MSRRPAGVLIALATLTLADQPVCAATDAPADGRRPAGELMERYDALRHQHGWISETIYAYPGDGRLAIRAWRTSQSGTALWIIAGIHGEEPAGPNAIASSLEQVAAVARSGVPMVLIPLANPQAYRNNWRYPNTAERDWRAGGYSVGDAEYLLPASDAPDRPRAAAAAGPETLALTQFVLRTTRDYPPRLVLDLHEDELSTQGGYVYSQGTRTDDNPAVTEVVRILQVAGMPLRLTGRTRFGEPIVNGIISHDDRGQRISDGSIDELLGATDILVKGRRLPGPAVPTVIVVETPAFAGSRLTERVAAHGAVLGQLPALWRLSASRP